MNIDLSNITVWEQYKKSDIVKDYFSYLKYYFEKTYRDLFYKRDSQGNIELGDYLKDFSIYSAVSEYVSFYIENIYGFIKPQYVSAVFYDSGLRYDTGYKYDSSGQVEDIPISIFVKLFTFIYNLEYDVLSIPSLAQLIADFCDIDVNEIEFKVDTTVINSLEIYVPSNLLSEAFKTLYDGYKDIFNLPLGFSMKIFLR